MHNSAVPVKGDFQGGGRAIVDNEERWLVRVCIRRDQNGEIQADLVIWSREQRAVYDIFTRGLDRYEVAPSNRQTDSCGGETSL